jgi:pimeloyl-ACP methyl ester carboxylesterase
VRRPGAAVLLLALAAPVQVWASDLGLVLMHGKWGSPDTGISPVADAAVAAGHMVESIEMPWSENREYDEDYEEALREVDAAVLRLRQAGAGRIVVGGHSLGANAALAHGATRRGLAGVMALAPGHVPGLLKEDYAEDVARARRMVDEGRGNDEDEFDDINQGWHKPIRMKARTYLSYFDPDGLGAMFRTAAQIRPGTPLLLVIGEGDPLINRAETQIFGAAPPHPKSRYVEVNSDHFHAPERAIPQIIEWLKGLE